MQVRLVPHTDLMPVMVIGHAVNANILESQEVCILKR